MIRIIETKKNLFYVGPMLFKKKTKKNYNISLSFDHPIIKV